MAAPQPARAPRAAAAQRGAPSPCPGSGAARRSGHASDVVTSFHAFDYYTDGAYPQSPLTPTSNGTLYGTAPNGGPGGGGVVYRVLLAGASQLTDVSGGGVYGASATLTAKLSQVGGPLAGQTVSFKLNGSPVGSAPTDSSGVAALSGVSLAGINAGSYPTAVEAAFAGGGSYQPSTGAGPLTVSMASTTTGLLTSGTPAVLGTLVTFTTTVASAGGTPSGTPSGTLTLKDGAATLYSGPLVGGQLNYQTSALSLGGNRGLDIFTLGYPSSATMPCGSTANEDAIEQTVTAGGSSLSYDPSTNQYTYVWKTEKSWVNTCRQLVVRLEDGTYRRANFKFK